MIETLQVNISQRLFTLEKVAFDKLHQYLESLKNVMNGSPQEIEEILADIEQRIADLLESRLHSGKLIISKTDIQEVIEVIGSAEEFADIGSSAEHTNSYNQNSGNENYSTQQGRARQLFRDIDSNIFGGVCSGLGWYFKVDPLWIRLALVALFFLKGFGLLTYIILWLIVPSARSTAQKMYMKGKDHDLAYNPSKSEQNTRNLFSNVLQSFGEIILAFFKIIAVVLLVCLVMVSLILVLGLATTLSIIWPFAWEFNTPHFFQPIVELMHHQPLFFSIFLLVIILIIISMLTGIVRLIFNIPKKNNRLAAFLWTFWALTLVFLIYYFVSHETKGPLHANCKTNIRVESTIDLKENQTLYIRTSSTETGVGRLKHFSIFSKEVIHNTSDNQYFLHPSFRIEPTEESEISLVEERSAIIPNFNSHKVFREIIYSFSQTDTTLTLPEYFSIGYPFVWNIPQVSLTLLIPEGRKIYFDESLQVLFNSCTWKLKVDNEILYSHTLTMKQGKLERQ